MDKKMLLQAFVLLIVSLFSISSVLAAGQCNCWDAGDCGGSTPNCADIDCTPYSGMEAACIPEFSGYAGIAALLGAVGMAVLVSKSKKRKS